MSAYIKVEKLSTDIREDLEIRGSSFRRVMTHIEAQPKVILREGRPVVKLEDRHGNEDDGIIADHTVSVVCPFCGGDVGNFCKDCGAKMIRGGEECSGE